MEIKSSQDPYSIISLTKIQRAQCLEMSLLCKTSYPSLFADTEAILIQGVLGKFGNFKCPDVNTSEFSLGRSTEEKGEGKNVGLFVRFFFFFL